MSLLTNGDRVAYPDTSGMAYLGTVVEPDEDYLNPHYRVSWDDKPEMLQSVPEEKLLKVTPLPTSPIGVITVTGTRHRRLRGWRKHAHLGALASGLVAVAVGTLALVTLH